MSASKVVFQGVTARALSALAASALAVLALRGPADPLAEDRAPVIVQARDGAAAAAAVRAVGGELTHELGIIDAVGATLTASQRERLRAACPGCLLHGDHEVRFTATESTTNPSGAPDTYFPTLIGAARLHAEGKFGSSATIAVLDTGFWGNAGLVKDNTSTARVLKQYNAITNTTYTRLTDDDESGHGAHVTGLAASANISSGQLYHGVAPGARLVSVKAFEANGSSTYANVIRGIDWVVANKTKYDIRVLNCSFSAPVRSWYWEDPLNQAVMKAWRAGIVVVVAAGNRGPAAQTIGVPGNVPYVVTVGAMSDNFTPPDGSDDRLATWSSTGPTYEGFVKPDLVAPGGHVLSLMEKTDYLPTMYPQFHDGNVYFTMSGTSQAAGVVSGVVAQIVSANPALTNNDVKCALIASARVAYDSQSAGAAYSIFQQGAGVVDAYGAVYNGVTGCANQGLDINAEFARKPTHYVGIAYQDSNGLYRLHNESGQGITWNGVYNGVTGYPWSSGYPWSTGYPWSNNYSWTSGYPWSNTYSSNTTWTNGYPWTSGYPWSNSLTEAASINVWVPQE